jgi:hypothetical protein
MRDTPWLQHHLSDSRTQRMFPYNCDVMLDKTATESRALTILKYSVRLLFFDILLCRVKQVINIDLRIPK